MQVVVLASGSSGNATVVTSGTTTVLVDHGISTRALCRRLEIFGHSVDDLSAILLTHEHSDHTRGLDVLQRRHPTPLWATAGTWSQLDIQVSDGGEIASGRELLLGSLRVLPVATSHDAREPVALVMDDGCNRLAVCTDTGFMTALLEQRLADCEVLLLEANHDADMLRHGPYPWPLKQRIASRRGHLANHQAEESLARLSSRRLRAVVGMHLSEENNLPQLAADALRRAAGEGPVIDAVSRWDMVRLTVDGDGVRVERHPVPTGRGRTLNVER